MSQNKGEKPIGLLFSSSGVVGFFYAKKIPLENQGERINVLRNH
jgi:hypothetical protein